MPTIRWPEDDTSAPQGLYQTTARHLRSRIRTLVQHGGKTQAEARREVFRDHQFWLGDAWSTPVPVPHQAALKVVCGIGLYPDPLDCLESYIKALRALPPSSFRSGGYIQSTKSIIRLVVLPALRLTRPKLPA